MKRRIAIIFAGALALSMAACGVEPAEEPAPPSSQEESIPLETPVEEDSLTEKAVSSPDAAESVEEPEKPVQEEIQPEAQVPTTEQEEPAPPIPAAPLEEEKQTGQPAEQAPAQVQQPAAEHNGNYDPEEVYEGLPPYMQPGYRPADDATDWTQERVDAVVEAYREAALARGWTEDTSLNVELTTGGAWGTPLDTRWSDYYVDTRPENIEEYLYGREFAIGQEPEDMYFHVVSENHGDYWEIYFIFAA